ncbi:hypothetical protein RD792_015013 [Penstemon davidsonii]|uniref:Homeobox protein knotted-1-like 3 n=1 Tax=Penstemon davidsonii TaxID=160366 RepID=A0ABR0CT67_9LAMI|nr:hypothetical protein RD792_015013 [Penstemon davidsonii]
MPPKVVMMTNGAQTPYGVFVGNTPQPCQANAAQHLVPQPQVQVVQDTTINRPLINDFAPSGGISMQTTECVTRESPKEYSSKVAGGVLRDDSTLLADHLRQIDGRLENLQICPSEILPNNNQNKAAIQVTEAPPLSNPNLYPHSMLGVNHDAERNLPIGEWQDNIPWSQSKIPGNVEAASSISPSYRVGETENSASLFSNQDPWSLRHDNQFPPPRPIKIQARRENARQMNSGESPTGNSRDSPLGDGAYQPSGNLNRDLNTEHVSSNKGSAEELIKQELQAVAEGVAASVLYSSVPSDPGLSAYGSIDAPSINPHNGETQNRVKFEEIKTKLPEKINLGFPASDGIGRLQDHHHHLSQEMDLHYSDHNHPYHPHSSTFHHQWLPSPPENHDHHRETSSRGGGGDSNNNWQEEKCKADILSHPLYEQLLSAHVSCLRIATPVDQLPRIDAQLARSEEVVAKYSVYGHGQQHPLDDKDLDYFMTHYVLLLSSFKEQLQQHVRVHAMEAVMACWELEQSLQSLTGVAPGEGTGATMSDDDEDQVDSETNLFDEGLDGLDSTGFGPLVPTESERSLMERVRQELKHELKQDYKEKIVDIREEILRKRRAGKLPGDTTSVLKSWWQTHSKWPYPTEEDKARLVQETGLQLKQINNWFINQRKRNWHSNPSSSSTQKSKRKK